MAGPKVVTAESRRKREERLRRQAEGQEERARAREEKQLSRVMGREVTGATALFVALRYAMGGGYPFSGHYGGPILPFYDILGKDRNFKRWYHHAFHEQHAGHFAEGLAASTGKVGVAVVTSGPGILNLVTACYDAMMDSLPVVFIAGNVSQGVANSMAFQEADVRKSFEPHAKKVFYVTSAGDIPSVVLEAFRLAKSGRPGPVVVDLPRDILQLTAEFSVREDLLGGGLEEKVEGGLPDSDRAALAELAERFASAKKPLLYVGGGVGLAGARGELKQHVAKTGAPVAYTLKGKGAFPDTDPLCIGMLGMHGVVAANLAAEHADLLVNIGARFDDRVVTNFRSFAPKAYIAHLDIDPRGIGPNGIRQPDLVIKGDVRRSLDALNGLIETPLRLGEWYEQIDGWKREFPLRYEQSDSVIKPQFVLEKLNEMLRGKGEDVIYVTDVGQHQMWAAQYLQTSNPRGFLTSGGGGTMGYGLPAALAAKLANPYKTVVLVSGESSFRMSAGALENYSMLNLDIKVVVIDNSTPDRLPGGMINQHFLVGGMGGTKTRIRGRNPSPATPASIADGYHVPFFEVKDPAAVATTLEQMLIFKGPVVANFRVDPDELVLPMMEAGKTVWDTIIGYDAASNAPVRLYEQFPKDT